MTTDIEVSEELYERLERAAAARHLTVGEFVGTLLDNVERQSMNEFGAAFSEADQSYLDEFDSWSAVTEQDAESD